MISLFRKSDLDIFFFFRINVEDIDNKFSRHSRYGQILISDVLSQ